MSEKNTGGPAFPSNGTMGEVVQEGMTLRDYFAAKVMQSIVQLHFDSYGRDVLAEEAYLLADAMLKARES